MTEVKQHSEAVVAAARKKAEDAEQARLLAVEQQRLQAEAAAKAADEERIQRREKIFKGERALLAMAADWRTEAETGKMAESESKIDLLLSHLTDLLATCVAQQEDIHSLDALAQNHKRALDDLNSRFQQLQRTVAAPAASTSNMCDRLNALEIDMGTLHYVSEHKNHTYLYSRSGGACQAWMDNLLSKYGVVAADLHTKISWEDLKAAWHKRFQVEPPEIKVMDKLLTFEQGTLPSVDWIAEYQRLTSVPNLQMGFKAINHYFISRSCPTLSNALTHVDETLTTAAELFDKAAQIIVTNKEAKNLGRSSAAGPSRDQHRPKVAVVVAAMPPDQSYSEVVSASEGDRLAAARDGGGDDQRVSDRFVLVYLDDILVYSQTLEDHLGNLRRVLETLRRAKYKANRHKCEFVRQELENLGHFVTPEGISPLSDKIQAIQEWPEPRNVKHIRSFLDLAGYYQRFIKSFSKIAANLTKLQCEDRPFDFDEDARESFLAIKAGLLSAEVLRIYDPLLPTPLTIDASGYGIGAILEQHDGVDWHPVEYFSKKVPVVHSIDDGRKKELLAFVHALKQWRHFLLGRGQFRWVTDKNPLVFYKTQDSTIAR
ncbi:hypothetical protein CBR_g37511 [Chara braunii]|uniref:Reverse transcriptase domain-containing protein n=1 Tax=Chara braunii TaxID=69332 RepID=A0A388LMY9_CHABU|nr:hypothetical protein CBR_g37511 [Chara braunii]|eukprot:GBG83710.1 hypothetical protein CBR_g37511 [Chara braunii]